MARPKITPELDAEIMARAARGESSESIAAWLKKAHRVVISGRSIRTRLAATRSERGDVVKSVLREKLATMVASDIDHLERIRVELEEDRARAREFITTLAETDLKRNEDDESTRGGGRQRKGPSHLEGAWWVGQYAKLTDLAIKASHTKLHFSGADAPDDPSGELTTAGERIRSRLAKLAPAAGAKPPPEGTGGNTG